MTTPPSQPCTRDCMTAPAIVVGPDDSARNAAELFIANRISGLPVVDADGKPIGVVSVSDFVSREASDNARRRDAWLRIVAGGRELSEDYLAALTKDLGPVRQLMVSPPICVDENAPITEVAKLISERRIKRVVVTRNGRIAGVVTRADLLRAFSGVRTGEAPAKSEVSRPPVTPSSQIRVTQPPAAPAKEAARAESPKHDESPLSADRLRDMVAAHQRSKQDLAQRAANEIRQRQQTEMEELLHAPLLDSEWQTLIYKAQQIAAQGGTECVIMRFPALLCEDKGRAINLPDPNWPETLRGKAALLLDRWRDELKPLGFKLTARIASFPNGLPGDVEVSLVWGRRSTDGGMA